MIITPRCKPIPMPDNIIEVVNKMREDDGMLDRMVFCNILKESTLDGMYGGVDSQDDSSCVSDKSWDMAKDGGQEDQKTIVYNNAINDDKIEDLNKEDVFHLRNGLVDNDNDDDNNHNHIK